MSWVQLLFFKLTPPSVLLSVRCSAACNSVLRLSSLPTGKRLPSVNSAVSKECDCSLRGTSFRVSTLNHAGMHLL
jgi:hypothetical protein